ncbi:MAG: metallophosphoesterase [Kiritimatiellae bacterium]|jgi:histidinol phosphatase-like PHP family hydrolase/predicted MPP superfamily phosphohydrolase|nr:metallophosphoesterase [Kiritimatiellia bacterium]
MIILAISDLHYSNLSRNQMQKHNPYGALSATLLKKTVDRLLYMNKKPDLIIITGDLLQGDKSPNAKLDLITLKGVLTRTAIPYLTLPGNHDTDVDTFNQIMGTRPGLHKYGEYGFIVYNDIFEEYPEYDTCQRTKNSIDETAQILKDNPELLLIALQHAPIYPSIDSEYPYNLSNANQVIDSYADSNIILSLSGHFHEGIAPKKHRGVIYHTIPALSKAPFPLSLIELDGNNITIKNLSLKMEESFITDVHCHTEHAYCGSTTDTAQCIALSQALGVSKLCITEHSFQLYFPKKTAMSFIWQSHPEMVEQAWRTPECSRMKNYHDFVSGFRSDYVKAGLEVDLYNNGQLLISPEDMEFGWDVIVGAVHFIEGFKREKINQSDAEKLFLRDVEHLLINGVHVLAHPFRFFGRNQLETPKHLFQPVAEMLAHYHVAAEINYHTHFPEVDFVKICVENRVKLALGSDTHELGEAGEFWPHINLMKRSGIQQEEMKSLIFQI